MADSKQARNVLGRVLHPEIKRSLVDLGMIQGVELQKEAVEVTLALPFLNIPIRDQLIGSVEQELHKEYPGRKVSVRCVEMSQQERAAFMTASEGGATSNRIERVIAVLSGKGGVGKSSVTALLAVALQRRGRQVGVLDADITGPSIPKMFGLRALPPAAGEGIPPAETASGIKVMSINLLLQEEQQAVIWRGPLISGAIKQFWGDVSWGSLDYLIVDLPPGTSDASLTVMQSIPLNGVLLVSSPQDLAGMVVAKAASMARQMKAPILGLIENMSYLRCPGCGERIEAFGASHAAAEAAKLRVPLLAQLPLDPALARACDAGQIEAYGGESFQGVVDAVERTVPATKTKPIF